MPAYRPFRNDRHGLMRRLVDNSQTLNHVRAIPSMPVRKGHNLLAQDLIFIRCCRIAIRTRTHADHPQRMPLAQAAVGHVAHQFSA